MWPDLAGVEGLPDALWLAGRETLLALPLRIAIVGTRSPSPYGEAQARRFADAFARSGALVVSGLARGVDAAAHRAVLDAGGATAAVLGSSVDRPWPMDALTERMGREGLLLSEFAPGTSPRRHHFPLRNRLISGLVQAVVVIEAAYRSGSLITARWAADQGRRVYALPGRVDHPMARGCHRILREGAELVEDPEEVLAELGAAPSATGPATNAAFGSEPEDPVMGALTGETLLAEEVAERAGVALSEALARLAELELDGRVQRAPGALYRLAVRGG
ncbi:MAG: DNA-protecting protein DprA [Planctomycetaceae bacterium]|nr:DNA-protecting protein DprA [Planctomycetaceae bacterium]